MKNNNLYFDSTVIGSLPWVEYFARRSEKTEKAMIELVETFTYNDVMWSFDLCLYKKHGVALETFQINRRNLVRKGILRQYTQINHRDIDNTKKQEEIKKVKLRGKIRKIIMTLSVKELENILKEGGKT